MKTTTTTKKPTTTKKQTTTKKATTANPGYRDVVYITPSGKRYHVSKDCAGKNAIEKSLKDVQASYGPCQTCSKQIAYIKNTHTGVFSFPYGLLA